MTAVRNTGLGLAAAATIALPTFVPVANAFEAQQVYGDMARLTPGDPVKVRVCVSPLLTTDRAKPECRR